MKGFIVSCLIVFSGYISFSQEEVMADELNILRLEELTFGYRLHTQGWSIFSDYGKKITYYKKAIYQFEILEYKHPKQDKYTSGIQPTFGYPTPKAFVYGKQNNFYSLRVALGRRRQIAEKAEKSGVEVSYTYLIGATLGILKPYQIYYYDPSNEKDIISLLKYNGENKEKFLDALNIYGSAGFSRGLFQSKLIPGVHGKFGLNFDWSPYDQIIRAIEVGLMYDIYIREIPIMIQEKNTFYFTNLYVSFQLGKRW